MKILNDEENEFLFTEVQTSVKHTERSGQQLKACYYFVWQLMSPNIEGLGAIDCTANSVTF